MNYSMTKKGTKLAMAAVGARGNYGEQRHVDPVPLLWLRKINRWILEDSLPKNFSVDEFNDLAGFSRYSYRDQQDDTWMLNMLVSRGYLRLEAY